jgi:Domain of Unknown Function (DUF1259)
MVSAILRHLRLGGGGDFDGHLEPSGLDCSCEVSQSTLHNRTLDDELPLFFVHFWANDDVVRLAHAGAAGLGAVHAVE